ncbi:Oligopeptide-binding protein AppA [Anaerolineae bacterium]|nr:Oligopeptide-binding protein AppA [Anaerolineae bacterium]
MNSQYLSRREFLRLAMLTSGGLFLAGCAPGVVPTAAPTGATPAPAGKPAATPAAAQPQYGGVLTRASQGEPANFDMFSNSSSFTLAAIAPCYNSLVMFDPLNPSKIIGDLAESWEIAPDGKRITFKLVKGAKFHDGKPLTSADVKYTFDTVRNPSQGVVSVRKNVLAAVDGIEAPDDYTVHFVLKRSNPSLLLNLATPWFLVAPKHILQEKGDMKNVIVGSGPFKLKEHVRGVSIELVKNPDYHVKGRPFLDGFKIFQIPDAATAFANFRTGQILYNDAMTRSEADQVLKELGDKVLIQSANSFVGDPFAMNSKRKPFDDIRVRKALAYAVDHNEAVKVLMEGDGVVAGLLPPMTWGLPASELEKLPGYGKDAAANRAEAKKLLAEAGYPNGFSATMVVRKAAGTHEARGLFLKDQFSKIGVEIKVDIQETAKYLDIMNKRDFDIATTVISGTADDPDSLLGDIFTCQGTLNYSGVCNPQADELFIQQSQTVDETERKKLVNQMELAYINGYNTVSLYYKKKLMGSWQRVHNYVMHPEPDNNRRLQEVWLSS